MKKKANSQHHFTFTDTTILYRKSFSRKKTRSVRKCDVMRENDTTQYTHH